MTTYRERRLIAAMDLGIYIKHMDGHRWIEADENIADQFDAMLKRNGVLLNNKIYGGVDEALDVIDKALIAMDRKTLAEQFNAYIDEDDVTCQSPYADNRIDIVEKGDGGLC